MAAALAEQIPGLGQKYEIMTLLGHGREFRGRYSTKALAAKIEEINLDNIYFLGVHSTLREEDKNVPVYSLTLHRTRFDLSGDAWTLTLYRPVEAGEKINDIAVPYLATITSNVAVSYAFATYEPRFNVDFAYSSLSAMHVDRETKQYKIITKAWDDLMVNPSALDRVIQGKQARSVYPINVLTGALARKIRTTLKNKSVATSGEFTSFGDQMMLWTVPSATARKELFGILAEAGLVFESVWFDLAAYKPSHKTIC
jgi:hypothetical protein